jgi:hypothetical protein
MNQQNKYGEHYIRYKDHSPMESNSNKYKDNDYSNVFNSNFNQQLSVSQEPDIKYYKREYYLAIGSKDRDVAVYPSSSQFSIRLPKEYKNIDSVELIQAIIPHKNNVTHEPYLVLGIDELVDTMESKDANISDAFAILMLNPPVESGKFISIDNRIHENTVLRYTTPKANLSKMTIRVTDFDGNIFSFGGDSTLDKEHQILLVFKITQIEKRQDSLNNRKVY